MTGTVNGICSPTYFWRFDLCKTLVRKDVHSGLMLFFQENLILANYSFHYGFDSLKEDTVHFIPFFFFLILFSCFKSTVSTTTEVSSSHMTP